MHYTFLIKKDQSERPIIIQYLIHSHLAARTEVQFAVRWVASLFMTLTITHNFKIIRINTRNMIVNYSSINYFGKPLHLLCNTKR